jgi:hypothetical protein
MTATKRIQIALTSAIFAATTFASSMAQATQPNGGHPQQKGDVFNRTTAPVPNAAANTYKRPTPPWGHAASNSAIETVGVDGSL